MPAIQKHPPPAAVRRNREIKAAAVSMTAVFGDRCHRPRVQPVDFPRHRPPPSALARALAVEPDCGGHQRTKEDNAHKKAINDKVL